VSPEFLLLLAAGTFAVAVLYSSVGHAGASGYIAFMSLLNLSPAVIRPTALALNILVASIATWKFTRAGHFNWRLFWPFAALATPAALLGGAVTLPAAWFKALLGLALLCAAWHFAVSSHRPDRPASMPPRWAALAVGAAIGLLSGLTGTGGGIFLTPLLLVMGWAATRQAAAVSAPFVLVNSVFGLAGNVAAAASFPSYIAPLLLAAGAGGIIGAHLGSRSFRPSWLKRFLAAVLLIAAAKLLLT
jgi:uncharacterized membrane protein YfcA